MIRTMTIEDYEQVHDLWMKIHGFGIRSVDDSKEGVERFLKRNPTTSVVAVEDDKIVGAILFLPSDLFYGNIGTSSSPSLSGSPKRRFIF